METQTNNKEVKTANKLDTETKNKHMKRKETNEWTDRQITNK